MSPRLKLVVAFAAGVAVGVAVMWPIQQGIRVRVDLPPPAGAHP